MRFDPEIKEDKFDSEKVRNATRKIAIALAAASTYYWFIKIVFL